MRLTFRSAPSGRELLILPAVSLCGAANFCAFILYVDYLLGHRTFGAHGASAILCAAWLGFYLALLRSHTASVDQQVASEWIQWKLVLMALLAYLLAQAFFLLNLPVFAWDVLGKFSHFGLSDYTKGVIDSWNEVAPLKFEWESRHPMLVHFYAALSNSVSPISATGLKAYLYNDISHILSALVLVHYLMVNLRGTAGGYLSLVLLFVSAVPLYENHILAYGYIEALQVLVLISTVVFAWLWIETRKRLYFFFFANASIVACFIKLHSWMYVAIILVGVMATVFDGFSIYRRKLAGISAFVYFLPPLALYLLGDIRFFSEISTLMFKNLSFSVMIVSAFIMLFAITHYQKYNVVMNNNVLGLVLVSSLSFYPFWAFVFFQYLVGTTSNVITGGSRVLLVCLCLHCATLVMALAGASKERLMLAAA